MTRARHLLQHPPGNEPDALGYLFQMLLLLGRTYYLLFFFFFFYVHVHALCIWHVCLNVCGHNPCAWFCGGPGLMLVIFLDQSSTFYVLRPGRVNLTPSSRIWLVSLVNLPSLPSGVAVMGYLLYPYSIYVDSGDPNSGLLACLAIGKCFNCWATTPGTYYLL